MIVMSLFLAACLGAVVVGYFLGRWLFPEDGDWPRLW